MIRSLALAGSLALLPALPVAAQQPFSALDVFAIEFASDVQVSPEADWVAYVRNGMSIMRDRREERIWMVRADGTDHRPLVSGEGTQSSPRWSPDGSRIAYVAGGEDGTEIYVYWVATGQSARLTQLARPPRSIAWSPDGSQIAFSMLVPATPPKLASMPPRPDGAEWADAPRVETRVRHEADGRGFIEPGFSHVFVIPADGGTARQLTTGDFHHRGPVWTSDGSSLLFTGNRSHDWEYERRESEIYSVSLAIGVITELTDRRGPDGNPAPSPDGALVAYVGFDDRIQTYQTGDLHFMGSDGSRPRAVLKELDRSVDGPVWAADGSGVFFAYDDEGITKLGFTTADGRFEPVAEGLGGTSVGRPYGGGNFSVARDGTVAFAHSTSDDPSDVVLVEPAGEPRVLTALNADLKRQRSIAPAEPIWTESSHDRRRIQSWIVHPPDFDPARRYPLLLEIHGGPVSNYGDRFSAEMQLYASAGYVVVYSNPRGSTSYGEEFGNLLYHDYPGNDYDDLMSVVDDVIARGYIDEDRLYVTGGSAGGIMTAWIVGKTDRFRAAVVTKPVVNWISKTLVADNYDGYMHYRYPGTPWENPLGYWEFSPLSLVANITTPTMVMVGTADLRTPLSESKQLYHALKLRRIETALVQIPGASHDISARPSQLITKVLHAMAWFERHGNPTDP